MSVSLRSDFLEMPGPIFFKLGTVISWDTQNRFMQILDILLSTFEIFVIIVHHEFMTLWTDSFQFWQCQQVQWGLDACKTEFGCVPKMC